ncbi:MAG: DUF167 domain-containing protein [Methanoregula sp.]|nr:DUF167 domain-containing protein [Methanoregula sp.]
MQSCADAVLETKCGSIITIEVAAGSKCDAFPSGFNEWRKTIGCRVTAPAREGRANRAVVAVIAATLNISESAVSIQSGVSSPIKRVLVQGISKPDILLVLQLLLQS